MSDGRNAIREIGFDFLASRGVRVEIGGDVLRGVECCRYGFNTAFAELEPQQIEPNVLERGHGRGKLAGLAVARSPQICAQTFALLDDFGRRCGARVALEV